MDSRLRQCRACGYSPSDALDCLVCGKDRFVGIILHDHIGDVLCVMAASHVERVFLLAETQPAPTGQTGSTAPPYLADLL